MRVKFVPSVVSRPETSYAAAMKHARPLGIFTLVLAACSSSSGDGIEPDPSTAPATSASSGAQAGGTGGGGGESSSSDQNRASNLAWARLQGEFDSVDQEPLNEGGPIPPFPRRLVGCAVDAPELGERVVYVERSVVDGEDGPDRQFLLAFRADPRQTPLGGALAFATVLQPVDPSAWEGRCVPGANLELLSDVQEGGEECFFSITMNEVSTLTFSSPQMPVACVSSSLDAASVIVAFSVLFSNVVWIDNLFDEEGTSWFDPPSPDDPDDGLVSYDMARRTPVVDSP